MEPTKTYPVNGTSNGVNKEPRMTVLLLLFEAPCGAYFFTPDQFFYTKMRYTTPHHNDRICFLINPFELCIRLFHHFHSVLLKALFGGCSQQ